MAGNGFMYDHAEIRCRFAQAVAVAKDIPVIDALLNFTDMHRRLTGLLPGESESSDRVWDTFAQHVAGTDAISSICDRVVQFAVAAESQTSPSTSPYWPFRYDYEDDARTVRLHFGRLTFGTHEARSGPGLLAKQRVPELRQQLKTMFIAIGQTHPNAEYVRGSSWLYNREAYRRVYPPAFTATHEIAKGGFQGGTRWGQFHTRTGVNVELRDVFLSNVTRLDAADLEAAFPIPTLSVKTSIKAFYAEYNVA